MAAASWQSEIMNIQKICLLTCHNLYESKRYFTQKFAEALNRQGIETDILSWPLGPLPEETIEQIEAIQPDLTCSFHQLPPQSNGKYFWDTLKHPHWTILVDPAFYDLELMQSPYSIISCVDRSDCDLLRSYHFENGFFWPHAVERELIAPLGKEIDKPLDVILLGTSFDPVNLRAYWRKMYPKKICKALDDAVERVLSDNSTSFFRALLQALITQGIDPHEVEFDLLAYYVDSYARGIDRLELVRSVKDATVHVFGGKCWRDEKPIEDWSYYLGKQPNVKIYPPVNFPDALELLKKSKICLNSMPFFKNGTHERVFASLACGTLPLTTDNIYMREIFTDEEDLLFYQFPNLDQVNDRVNLILNKESDWKRIISNGQTKVKASHTWDSRVDMMLKELPPILNGL